MREASEFALKEFIKNPTPENEIVRLRHFEFAFKKIKPSVSLKVIILTYSETVETFRIFYRIRALLSFYFNPLKLRNYFPSPFFYANELLSFF